MATFSFKPGSEQKVETAPNTSPRDFRSVQMQVQDPVARQHALKLCPHLKSTTEAAAALNIGGDPNRRSVLSRNAVTEQFAESFGSREP